MIAMAFMGYKVFANNTNPQRSLRLGRLQYLFEINITPYHYPKCEERTSTAKLESERLFIATE